MSFPGRGTDLAYGAQRSTVMILGDSISAAYGIQRETGWVALLNERLSALAAPISVINASVSGETTGGGLARLRQALDVHDPAIVVIELGGNDGLRGYPIARIRDNLNRIVALAKVDGRQVLLIGMQIPPNYGPRYTRAFTGMYAEIAEAHEIGLVPFFLEEVALTPELMQRDGIHPTADAQTILLDTVWPYLENLLP
ncbi:MAG: arylesterase [Gammaproteobacteria bacterium]|nr:arylesterase [Gammaproteobacteria bacterium]